MATTTNTPGLSRIGQVAILVKDLDAAIVFYRDKLGLKFLFKAPPHLGFFECGGVRLMLDAAPEANTGGTSVIYYNVEDIHGSFKTLSDRGVKFESEPHLIAKMPDHELWMAFLRDVDDNLLALMAELRGRVS